MKVDRLVAGYWCHEVLARLSEYMDGELEAAERGQVEAHLRGCDGCARFGGELSATVQGLRRHLLAEQSGPTGLGQRLRRALDAEEG